MSLPDVDGDQNEAAMEAQDYLFAAYRVVYHGQVLGMLSMMVIRINMLPNP